MTDCPITVIVGVVRSVSTIRRIPLGSVISVGWRFHFGTASWLSCVSAQGGNCTGLVGALVTFSAAAKSLACNRRARRLRVSVPTMAFCSTRYCFATRSTSATVTFLMASTSCSRRGAAFADHSLRPQIGQARNRVAIEFAEAISSRLAAATRSGLTPCSASWASRLRIALSIVEGFPFVGNTT